MQVKAFLSVDESIFVEIHYTTVITSSDDNEYE